MTDLRVQRLAEVLVHYSLGVKPGQHVMLASEVLGLPLARAAYATLVRAGANVTVRFRDAAAAHAMLRDGSDDQLVWLDPTDTMLYEQADALLVIRAHENTRAGSNLDPARVQKAAAARRSLNNTLNARTAAGQMTWVLTDFPTTAAAQEANMSLEDYEDFVYRACFCDRDDPVAAWRGVHAEQERLIAWLAGRQQVHLHGPNVDLRLSVAGRTWLNASGNRNMPDGEIFTGPLEDSAEGWVHFSYPTIQNGRLVEGVRLRFEGGRVVEASAHTGQDLLDAKLNADEGARRLGEFAIGTNHGVDRFTGSILFDEKIGGTFHLALGNSYPDTGGTNQSAIHWDMICDLRHASTITVDGDLFYQDGQFVV